MISADVTAGEATVPSWMTGCWRRDWIRFADGSSDTDTRVVWLQTFSGYVDIRVPPRLTRGPSGTPANYSNADLLFLASQQASCGRTTHVVQDGRVQARWSRLIGYELESTFPEPGWMDWHPPDCMMEYAPSGAYSEDWRLNPGSDGLIAVLEKENAERRTLLYVAGDHVVRVRDRLQTPESTAPLCEFVEDVQFERSALRDLLDCEFSYAVREAGSGRHVVHLSTLPQLEGSVLEVGGLLKAPLKDFVSDPLTGEKWRVRESGALRR